MRTSIIGASGLLGKYLVRDWKRDAVIALSSKDVDIRQRQQVRGILERYRPESIVLAAAYTDVDGCEANPELAFSINATGALNVAEAAKEYGAHLLFLSTDYVFDGTKSAPYETNDPRNPQSVYGRSKAEAEIGILRLLSDACIVRTSWLFGTTGKCFPETILRLARDRTMIDVVNDQRGAPTYARHLAHAIIDLAHKRCHGIIHASNAGDCSWFEFASEIIRISGAATVIRPTTTELFPRPAKRPTYSVLSPKSLQRYGIEMPTWKEALEEYLNERSSAGL
ncbi:MAG: dTDP-4-dehydrorhamnose reductase [Acidobacteria bacterium]|nr:dTDP-4-dehydrorhamnose reductase [Acidobacteriota bacterium]